jgi:2-polyprenyl-3-methyl-5-hydroxy-6-metoxy-1,4-benzoquinol methylase
MTPTPEDDASCAWCGADLDPRAEHPVGRLRCERCGSQTTWPIPTDAELERAYGDWYRPQDGRFSGVGDHLLRRLRGRLAGRIDDIAPPGRVLDVGAGDGALLDALAARGRAAVGLERHATRPDVKAVEVTDYHERCSAVVFWHSLEHLRDAGDAVEHGAALLEPSGSLVIAMPNPASVQARLFGDRWLALDLPRHLVHVPARALIGRLESLGLRVERTSYLRGGQVVFGWAHGLVGSLPGHPHLYDAIRRPQARQRAVSAPRRLATLAAGAASLPVAGAAAVAEAAARRGGTVYVEARRV